MMAMLSIPSYKTDDPNYRYKMPRVVAKVEGRGNGIKTNIMNMGDIARALKRPPDYPTKFCGTELGAQSKFDSAEGKAIVNGAHESRDLQTILDKFIEKFVLCNNCNLPEIDLIVKKGRVQFSCNACGQKGDVDHSHKLTAFILKNPPKGGDSTMGGAKKKSSKETTRVKAVKASKEESDEAAVEDASAAGAKKKKKSLKQQQKTLKGTAVSKTDSSEEDGGPDELLASKDVDKKEAAISNKSATVLCEGTNGDGGETSDEDKTTSSGKKKSKKKNSKQQRAASAAIAEVDVLKYKSEALDEIIKRMFNFTCTATTAESETAAAVCYRIKDEVTPEAFSEQLRLLQMSQSMDHVMKFYVALEVLFSAKLGGLTAQTLFERMKYLRAVSLRTRPNCILGALQDFMYFNANTPVAKEGYSAYAAVLYSFYDNDLLPGETISNFYASEKIEKDAAQRESHKAEAFALCLDAAKPFLEWLDKDEDEENDEQRKQTATVADKKVDTPQTKAFSAAEQSDSDIDIDAL